jgi:hypothetical protein
MAKDQSEYKIDMLFKEYDQVSQGIRSLVLFSERILALGIAIMTIGLAYGLKEKINEILIFQPVVVSAVLLYAAHIYAELRAMAGYKMFLEEKINIVVGEQILLWEGVLAKRRRRAIGQKLLYLIYLILYLVTVHLSLNIAWTYGLSTFIVIVSLIIILLVGIIVSYVEMYKALGSFYENAKSVGELPIASEVKILEKTPEPAIKQIKKKKSEVK